MWGICRIQAWGSIYVVSVAPCAVRACLLQVNVGNKYNLEAGLGDRCSARRGDFQTLPFEDAQFDAAYQIEATCHSPDKVRLAYLPGTALSHAHVERLRTFAGRAA